MKKKLRLWLCVLLAVACAGTALALPEQGGTAIWQSYVLQVEWAQIGDQAPDGMQAEEGMRYARVHINSLTGGVRTADIADYGWEIELRHDSDGEARTPEMYTSYSTTFDKGSSGLVSAESQEAFDLLYRVPEGWAREDITLAIPPHEGPDTLIPLRTLADAAPQEGAPAPQEAETPAGDPAEDLAGMPTAQGMVRLTLTPSATVDFPDMDAETANVLTQVAQYLEKVEIEASFTLLDGAPYAALRLFSDGTDLGVVEAYLQGDRLYLRGDMLPEGWVTVDLGSLLAGSEGPLATGTLADIGTSIEQVVGAFADSMEAWSAAQPEGTALSQTNDLRDWPRYYFLNAQSAERMRVPYEAVEQALRDTDTALRALARTGELIDLDGTHITSEDQYEESLAQQVVYAAGSWNSRNRLSLAMDSVRAGGQVLEVSYDLSSNDYMKVLLVMFRRLPWSMSGMEAYSGEIQRWWGMRGDRLDAHLDILANSDAGQYDLHAAGKSGSRSPVWFDSQLALTLPEEDAIFLGSADTRIYDEDNELRVNLRLDAAHNTADSRDGAWDDLTLTLALDLGADLEEYEQTQSLQAGLGIHYQRLAEEPVLHDLSDVRIHLDAYTAQEEMDAYEAAMETTLATWLIKVMATLPPGLLQIVMADYM